MIYVRVELWPGGDRSRSKVLAEGKVWNNCQGTRERGHYGVELRGRNGKVMARDVDAVRDFPRRRLHVWDLLQRALTATRGGRS